MGPLLYFGTKYDPRSSPIDHPFMCTAFSTIRGVCLKLEAMKLCCNYLINSTKERHEFAEKSSTQTGNVYKRTLQERKHTHIRLVMNLKQSRNTLKTLQPHWGQVKLDLKLKTHSLYLNLCMFTSFPRGKPLPSAQVSPTTLATNVFNVRYSFSTTPLRIVFISGIPDPDSEINAELRRRRTTETSYGCVNVSASHRRPEVLLCVWSLQRNWWEPQDKWPKPNTAGWRYCPNHHTSTSEL